MKIQQFFFCLGLLLIASSCKNPLPEKVATGLDGMGNVVHPGWAASGVVYEVNVRHFSPYGTLIGVTEALPVLRELGVDILCLMPVHPVSDTLRPGTLGNLLSVKDFTKINSELGTFDDFRQLVVKAHELEMKVLLDWVPDGASLDNPLVKEHPDWFLKSDNASQNNAMQSFDIVHFDYSQRALRDYMLNTMLWWLRETGIDGFRYGKTQSIPVEFWNELRPVLYKEKEVFLLANSEFPELFLKAFDAGYDNGFHGVMNAIAKGKSTAAEAEKHFTLACSINPQNFILLYYTNNSFGNSFAGTDYEKYGDATRMFAALTFTVPGMPSISNGQENCLDKRLLLYEKDAIERKDCEMFAFYRKLIELRKNNIALWSGMGSKNLERIATNHGDKIFAFRRIRDYNRVICIFNFSPEILDCKLENISDGALLTEYFSNMKLEELNETVLQLKPWDFKIFVQE